MADIGVKQKLFADEYIVDLDPVRAYQKVYKCKGSTAKVNAYRLLDNASVSLYIASKKAKIASKLELDAEYVLRNLKAVAERCMQAEPVMIKVDGELVGSGDYKFDSTGANKSLELLGKYLKLFTDKVEHTGHLGVTITDDIK